jgi:conjugative relaxase-like TrwC/TraI family protein
MRPRNISGTAAGKYYYEKDPIFSNQSNSKWHGTGSKELGLAGDVKRKDFLNIIAGNDLMGNQIIQDGVNGEHRAAVDFPFSAPKSVSILALHVGDDRLIEAHKDAVVSTIRYIEENYVFARKTTDGVTELDRTGKGVFATFTHSTSRENDPQLHTHTLAMNMTKAGNGWRAVWNDQIFRDQTLLNSIYQSYLAKNVKELGYSIENKSGGKWEIAGVKQDWIDIYSKRSEAINAKDNELDDQGKFLNDAVRRNTAVLDSRPEKDVEISENDLHSLWKSQVSPKEIKNHVNKIKKSVRIESKPRPCQYIDLGIKAIHETEATFKKKDAVNFALRLSRGETTVTDIERGFLSEVKEGKVTLLKELKNRKGLKIPIYSTLAMEKTEKNVLDSFMHGKGEMPALVESDRVQNNLKQKYSYFTPGQANIVKHILTSKDQFLIIQGDAGTGKTSAMAAVNQILGDENQNWSVRGLAFTGKAASELEDRAGFNSQTISGFLKTPQDDNSKLWIVDESSMVGTIQMSEVVGAAKIQNAKVVFVGDGKQLQAISAGRMFKDLQENGHIETVKMEEALRQKTEPMIRTVQYIKNFQEGMDDKGIDKAFRELQKSGNIIEVKDGFDRSLRVAKDYVAEGNIKETLILTSNNIARVEMNDLIREDLKQRGVLAEKDFSVTIKSPVYISGTDRYFADSFEVGQGAFVESETIGIKAGKELKIVKCDTAKNTITVAVGPGKTEELDLKQDLNFSIYKEEDRKFSEKDKIVFLKNDKKMEVQNGVTGTIKGINSFGKLSVEIDESDRTVGFHPDNYKYFDHGYAVTTTKSQGQTAQNVLFITDSQTGYANKTEHLYVAASRAERNVKIYTDDSEKVKEQFKIGQNKTSVLQNRKENTISRDTTSPKVRSLDKFKGQEL